MRAEAGFPWFRAWRTRGQKEGGGVSARAHFANPRVSHAAVTDRNADPLLLDSERRYLENPAGSTRVTWRAVPPHPSIRTAAPFSICVTSVDTRSATTFRLRGSPISTSRAQPGSRPHYPGCHIHAGVDHHVSQTRTNGKAREPGP